MPEACFAIPGDLASCTGGYAYARALFAAMPTDGWDLRHLALPATFPDPDAADLEATSQAFRQRAGAPLLLVDGLAFGSFPQWLLEEHKGRWLALVHHPLALETGLEAERAAAFAESERLALSYTEAVLAASPETAAELVRGYGVPREKITVAEPGTKRPAEPAQGSPERPCLLCVGTISARKGQDVLVEALAELTDLSWSCRLVGSDRRDPRASEVLRDLSVSLGLSERIEIAGELLPEEMAPAYAAADVFVLPSRYEGYGMAFAEAMAHGLPIVACPTGGVPDTVPQSAALFVPAGSPMHLAAALRSLLTDRSLLKEKAAESWRIGRSLPSWQETAAKVANALSRALRS